MFNDISKHIDYLDIFRIYTSESNLLRFRRIQFETYTKIYSTQMESTLETQKPISEKQLVFERIPQYTFLTDYINKKKLLIYRFEFLSQIE